MMGNGPCQHHLGLSQILLGLEKACQTSFARDCTVQQRLERSKILVWGLLYRHDGAGPVQGRRMLTPPRLVVGTEYLEEPGHRMYYGLQQAVREEDKKEGW